MKKLILILTLLTINIVNIQNANAYVNSKGKDVIKINGVEKPAKKIKELYFKWKETASDQEKIFIPKRTLYCNSIEGFKKGYRYVLATSGSVRMSSLAEFGCRATIKWTHGTVVWTKEDSKIIQLVFEKPYYPLASAYFNQDNLMTFEQSKKLMSIQ